MPLPGSAGCKSSSVSSIQTFALGAARPRLERLTRALYLDLKKRCRDVQMTNDTGLDGFRTAVQKFSASWHHRYLIEGDTAFAT